jgi:protoheme IX farnesyltransferase
LLYTILLVLVTILPYLSGMSGLIYLGTALALGGRFLAYAIQLRKDDGLELPMVVFRFSINYLMILFVALLIDHYYIIRLGV